jgi:hypothetical protein
MYDAVRAFRPSVVAVDPISNLTLGRHDLDVKPTLVRPIDFLKQQITPLFTCLSSGLSSDGGATPETPSSASHRSLNSTLRSRSQVSIRLFEAAQDGVLLQIPKRARSPHDELVGKELYEIGLVKDEVAVWTCSEGTASGGRGSRQPLGYHGAEADRGAQQAAHGRDQSSLHEPVRRGAGGRPPDRAHGRPGKLRRESLS